MEEVSILAQQPICNESSIGCDVHSTNVVCCSLQKSVDGSWIQTKEVFDTNYRTLPLFTDWCQRFAPKVIVMESTGTYWMSPYDALEAAGLPITIVNPAQVKGMAGHKTDQEDANRLAQIGVNGSYKKSFIPEKRYRDLRMVNRNITKMQNQVSSFKNRETKIFVAAGYRLGVFSSEFGKIAEMAKDAILEGKSPEEILAMILADKHSKKLKATKEELLEALHGNLTPALKLVIESNRRIRKSLEEEIKLNKEYLLNEVQVSDNDAFRLLQTIPGIDALAAAIIIVELGGTSKFLEAFKNADKFAGWVGLCPGHNQSNKKTTGKKGRHGDRYLRSIFCEAAQAAVKAKGTTFRSKYQSLVIRLGKKKAVFAIAHKLSRVIYSIISHHSPYIDPHVDYAAIACQRNKARWLKQLVACKDITIKAINKTTGEEYDSTAYQEHMRASRAVALRNALAQ